MPCFEEVAIVVIAPTGKHVACSRPCQSADLLGVYCHACEERHGSMPAEKRTLSLRGPLDAVNVDVTNFIPDE